MIFLSWIALLIVSLWVSVAAFMWAMQTGQFREQGRARYLPLGEGLPPPPENRPRALTMEACALVIIGLIALGTIAGLFVVSLRIHER
jgi:nitrogen fixation-related uncharacterized protein